MPCLHGDGNVTVTGNATEDVIMIFNMETAGLGEIMPLFVGIGRA
ncbi:hypothetical protein [Desulforhopalus vacuolatus]|nr:hypothetical protein [Desulforhopalus vacuolatus]